MPLKPSVNIDFILDGPMEKDPLTGEMVLLLMFGKFRDEPTLITDEIRVESSYLRWMVLNDHTYQEQALKELHRRGLDPFDDRDWEKDVNYYDL